MVGNSMSVFGTLKKKMSPVFTKNTSEFCTSTQTYQTKKQSGRDCTNAWVLLIEESIWGYSLRLFVIFTNVNGNCTLRFLLSEQSYLPSGKHFMPCYLCNCFSLHSPNVAVYFLMDSQLLSTWFPPCSVFCSGSACSLI